MWETHQIVSGLERVQLNKQNSVSFCIMGEIIRFTLSPNSFLWLGTAYLRDLFSTAEEGPVPPFRISFGPRLNLEVCFYLLS